MIQCLLPQHPTHHAACNPISSIQFEGCRVVCKEGAPLKTSWLGSHEFQLSPGTKQHPKLTSADTQLQESVTQPSINTSSSGSHHCLCPDPIWTQRGVEPSKGDGSGVAAGSRGDMARGRVL